MVGSMCYWCHWGWPKPIRDIYDGCVNQLCGNESPLLHGPSHIVWADENWDSAQWCLDHFNKYKGDYTDDKLRVVRESLERLIAVPDEYKQEPIGFDDDSDPADFPPPEHWKCELR